MDVVGIVAFLVALVGLLTALWNVSYLSMLNNAAKKRGSAGEPTIDYVVSQRNFAYGTTAVGVLGLVISGGNLPFDIVAILLGGGAGIAAKQALDKTRTQFRSIS